jgi:hypothetical protein
MFNDMSTVIAFSLIALLTIVAIFLLIREIMLWYWKVNKAIAILENIEFILKNIVKYQEKEKTEKEYIDSKKP